MAPAGSGKTTTLVARVAWLVGNGVAPATICAITFNRRAAEELEARLDEALAPLGLPVGSVRVRTFHALGREILVDSGERVDDVVDRATVLAELTGEPPGSPRLRLLDDAFSQLKLEHRLDRSAVAAVLAGRPASGGPVVPAGRTILEWFVRYEEALVERGALDFDDLVARGLRLLEEDARALERWRGRAGELLVDEVQDLDRSQLRLALLLAGPAAHIFLVGDDDQTIYAWRLADVRRILGLAARLPGLRRVDLETNYRCPANVVRRAVRLIERNRERFAKRVRPRDGAEGSVLLAPDPGDDVARARRLLRSWPADGGGSRAVLARTNEELAPYAAVALALDLGWESTEDPLVLDDPRLDALLDAAEDAAEDAARESRAMPLLVLLGTIRERAPPEHDDAASTLLAWAAPYDDLPSFRQAIGRARSAGGRPGGEGAPIVLATAHGTKGLEFDHVACVGLDERRFPSARTLAEASDAGRAMEEERRLAYVAWTRARRSLTLLYDPWSPSPFMLEAFDPSELAG